MKKTLLLLLPLVLLWSCGQPSAVWTEGPVGENGRAQHTLELRNMPAGGRVWYQELFDDYEITGGPVKEIKHFQGTSRYLDLPQGGTLTITYLGRPLPRHSWAPEGFMLQQKGKADKPIPVEYHFLDRKGTPIDSSLFAATYEPRATDIIPQVKGRAFEGESHPAGWYKISFDDKGEPSVEADDEDGAFFAQTTLKKLPEGLSDTVIEDWPDLGLRGFMLDVVRDFRSKEEVLKVL